MQHDPLHRARIFVFQAEQIGGGFAALIVNTPDVFVAGIGRFIRRLGDFDGRNPVIVIADRDQLIDAAERRFAPRSDQPRANAVRQPVDQAIRHRRPNAALRP